MQSSSNAGAGVAVPQYALRDQTYWHGDLLILDTRDDGVNRVIKTARLATESAERVMVLFERHIVWMNEERFTLQDFERVLQESKVVEFAQSWLCSIDGADRT